MSDQRAPPACQEPLCVSMVRSPALSLFLAGLPELVQPLVNTLRAILVRSSCSSAVALIAHQTRARVVDEAFHSALDAAGLRLQEIPHTAHHPVFHHPVITMFRISKA